VVTRKTDSKAKTKDKEPSEAQLQAKARSERLAQVKSTLENLKDGLSSSTTIGVQGPNGEAYAGYESVLKSIYQRRYDLAVSAAGDITDGEATVVATVTVERNGSVTKSRVVTPSGNSALDKLVRRVLDEVTSIRPFPEGAKDSERTFTIGFELKPKRAIG
jgi:TonB family protein